MRSPVFGLACRLRSRPFPVRLRASAGRLAARLLAGTLLCAAFVAQATASPPLLLLQAPTVSQDRIAFVYADDLWIADRAGGDARLLVRTDLRDGGPWRRPRASGPRFSPDGRRIAYSAVRDGNLDVYVVASDGGEPKRLTAHPGDDAVVGWTPDGRRVLFVSRRDSANGTGRLYTVSVDGGQQLALPLSRAEGGAYSPDAARIAYEPQYQSQPDWYGYRGGQTTPIWIAALADSSIVRIPHENATDRNPMWIGDTVYFLSDRDGPSTLYAYDTRTGQVTRVLENSGFPIDSASAGPDAIVYSQMGAIHLFDPASRGSRRVPLRVTDDGARLRPYFEKGGKRILNAALSPTGARAVFEARGDIVTVPAAKGDPRNLTATPGAAERDPAWSPDGKSIAYFSDASGEYALHVRDQDGAAAPRVFALGQPPSFFHSPQWSPDSRRIAYRDKRLNLWVLDLAAPTPVRIDRDRFDTPLPAMDVAWSPDSRWIAYTRQLPNHLNAVFAYSLATRKSVQVTDGASDCRYPQFDRNGRYLYFTASTDLGLTPGWLDMSSLAHPVTRAVYVAVLRRDQPSPLAPESDEEPAAAPAAHATVDTKADAKAAAQTRIDFDGIGQRILALPVAAANYVGMHAGKSGELFLQEAPLVLPGIEDDFVKLPVKVRKFSLATRKTDELLADVASVRLSFDGGKLLYRRDKDWFIAATDAAPKPGEGRIGVDAISLRVDPRQEWAQMYREAWRLQRDYFYDPGHHGLDLAAAQRHFEPFLAGIGSRHDLDVLFRRMLSYLSVGHMYVIPLREGDDARAGVGLLGADYDIAAGRYRFAHIYDGENWNPELRAPLTAPGVGVRVGDHLLAVNGRELRASDDLYAWFEETAGKRTVLRVSADASGAGARDIAVVPVKDEQGLRRLAWIEANRRTVDRLSGGKLAYVHLPDTAEAGYASFNRYFFAQTDKQGAVIDARFNRGGMLADYIVDYLARKPMTLVVTREGEPSLAPMQAMPGPKAMLINELSGSGGDALPWYFKRLGLGPLIGTRTWGGLIGIYGYPAMIDGSTITSPRLALGGLHGSWEVENRGVAPDIEIDDTPRETRAGGDPQLERAVQHVMQQLREQPPQAFPPTPPYPDFRPVLPPLPEAAQ